WADHVTAMLALGTREGSSVRGGDLGGLADGPVTDGGAADALIDAAVLAVGEARGIAVTKPAAAAGGGVVDSAALGEFAEKVTGPGGVLAETARTILEQLGISEAGVDGPAGAGQTDSLLADLVSDELGSDWARQVAPAFDARKAVLLDDRWASAREGLARMWLAGPDELGGLADGYATVDVAVAAHADWWRRRAEREGRDALAAEYAAIAAAPRTGDGAGEFAAEVAVV